MASWFMAMSLLKSYSNKEFVIGPEICSLIMQTVWSASKGWGAASPSRRVRVWFCYYIRSAHYSKHQPWALAWALKMLLRLDQISAHFGIVQPKKEACTLSRNQGIFLQFWKTLFNGCPLRLELMAFGAGPYFNFVSFTSWSATLHSEIVPVRNWTDV